MKSGGVVVNLRVTGDRCFGLQVWVLLLGLAGWLADWLEDTCTSLYTRATLSWTVRVANVLFPLPMSMNFLVLLIVKEVDNNNHFILDFILGVVDCWWVNITL